MIKPSLVQGPLLRISSLRELVLVLIYLHDHAQAAETYLDQGPVAHDFYGRLLRSTDPGLNTPLRRIPFTVLRMN